jgi:hypothetical protein
MIFHIKFSSNKVSFEYYYLRLFIINNRKKIQQK